MSLTKKDLNQALSNQEKRLEKMMDKKLGDQRDKIIAYVKVRHDEHSNQIQDIKSELKMINGKLDHLEREIEEITEMETGDIKKAYEEIEAVKSRLSIMENKLAMMK